MDIFETLLKAKEARRAAIKKEVAELSEKELLIEILVELKEIKRHIPTS